MGRPAAVAGGQASRIARAARAAGPLAGGYDALLDDIGDASVVLIGEASHGTEEFYRDRAFLTQRLIEDYDFAGVAVEADWPDAHRVNAYVRGEGRAPNAERALGGFERFPTWMWRNTVVVEFVEWLRARNMRQLHAEAMVGCYGLDLYSLYRSIESVIVYLDRVDPDAAARARRRYSCFDDAGEDAQAYGYAAGLGLERSCEDEAVAQLLDLHAEAAEYAQRDGRVAADELFDATQNARVVRNAEQYYRSMFGSRVSTWNLRDRHMAATLHDLIDHLGDRRGGRAKVVVWAHNSHLGDARATEMSRRGELNLGQLARETYGAHAFNIGFTTHRGTVTAASDWGEPAERKRVREALDGSWEQVMHRAAGSFEHGRFQCTFRDSDLLRGETERLERAIGVIYRPQTERASHYFLADIAEQFDALIHIDHTHALEPLERTPQWITEEPPETFPFAE